MSSAPQSRIVREGDHELALEALRSLPTALIVVRDDGMTLLANRRACAALERARAEVEGELVSSYLAPIEALVSAEAHDERSAKLRVTLPSGRAVTIGFAAGELRQLESASEQPAYAIVLEDVTEVERLREERDRLLQIATVHEILPSILHEVKNPLAAIATTAELLVEEAPDESTRGGADAILHEAQRMKLTLQGIGAVGRRLESDRHEAVDHAVREACAILKVRAESLGVRAHCVVPDLPPLPLDASVVCALVFNLFTNAVQACPAGGHIEMKAELEEGGGALLLTVADDGVGMAPDVLARCRELFFTTKARGTGIGLALCNRAVTEAGGTMDIESAVGRGTRIALRIPLEAPPRSEPPA